VKERLHITVMLRRDGAFDVELADVLGREVLTVQAIRRFAKPGDCLVIGAEVAPDGTVSRKTIKPVRHIKDFEEFDDPFHGPLTTVER
jgi:hypothetical protein